MDGGFYNDLRAPFIVGATDIAAVTLLATDLPLYGPSNFPVLGGQYFYPGKKMHIRLFARMTTAATPGNLTMSVYYGDGTAANGVLLCSTLATALTLNKTALTWTGDIFVRCCSVGSAGTLFCNGEFHFNVGLIASTLQPILLPDSTPVVSGACDLTASKIISVQAKRSGSTAETMQVHDIDVIGMN
jgi:hypothetical protein